MARKARGVVMHKSHNIRMISGAKYCASTSIHISNQEMGYEETIHVMKAESSLLEIILAHAGFKVMSDFKTFQFGVDKDAVKPSINDRCSRCSRRVSLTRHTFPALIEWEFDQSSRAWLCSVCKCLQTMVAE